jgi:hypothetical protein
LVWHFAGARLIISALLGPGAANVIAMVGFVGLRNNPDNKLREGACGCW